MPAALAAGWFGKAPPDLSLEARAKGSDWVYNYLKSFYLDPSRPVGWNNTVFPNVSMPNALWELQGLQVARRAAAAKAARRTVEKLEIKTPGRVKPRPVRPGRARHHRVPDLCRRARGAQAPVDGRLGAALPRILHVHRLAPQARVLEGRALTAPSGGAGHCPRPGTGIAAAALTGRRACSRRIPHDALPQRPDAPASRLGACRSA